MKENISKLKDNCKCVIISAPSGAGKTSITKHLISKIPSLSFSVSVTTRLKRKDEIEGVDYYFMSKEEFMEKVDNDEFIEWEEVFGSVYYGTLRSEVERLWKAGKSVCFDTDVKGGLSLTRYFLEDALTIFVKAKSIDILRERLIRRDTENEETINIRMEKAKREIDYEKWFDVTIVNHNLEEAKEEAYLVVNSFLNL